jgi:hypothetical protein
MAMGLNDRGNKRIKDQREGRLMGYSQGSGEGGTLTLFYNNVPIINHVRETLERELTRFPKTPNRIGVRREDGVVS